MSIKILFFGMLADVAGNAELSEQSFSDTDTLNAFLHHQYPDMKNLTYRIAVNQEIVNGNTKLKDGDEVALLPPFAGG